MLWLRDFLDRKAWDVRPPAPPFSDDDIPYLSGKVIVVTGANAAGIGKESARALLSKGAKVIAACRSEGKAKVAIEELKTSTGSDAIHFLQLDLEDGHSCIQAGKELSEREERLNVVLLNSGVMSTPTGSV